MVELLEEALKDEPAIKTAVQGLIAQIALVTADGAIVISGKVLYLSADWRNWRRRETFISWRPVPVNRLKVQR